MNKKAFTIAETMVVMILIGILATITLSSLSKSVPDKNKLLFKKSYSIVERTIAELVNDESLYPYDPDFRGFRNLSIENIPQDIITDAELVNPTVASTDPNKFCKLFKNKLNVIEDNGDFCNFTTSDGITWTIPNNAFPDGTSREATIIADINGEKDPNEDDANNISKDQFQIIVRYDGKVLVNNVVEQCFLKSTSAKIDYDDECCICKYAQNGQRPSYCDSRQYENCIISTSN